MLSQKEITEVNKCEYFGDSSWTDFESGKP